MTSSNLFILWIISMVAGYGLLFYWKQDKTKFSNTIFITSICSFLIAVIITIYGLIYTLINQLWYKNN